MERRPWFLKDKRRLIKMVEDKIYTTQEIADELERSIYSIHKQKSRMGIVNRYKKPETAMPLFHTSLQTFENAVPTHYQNIQRHSMDLKSNDVSFREQVPAPELPVGSIQINIHDGCVNVIAFGLTYKQGCRAMLKIISKIV